MPDRIRVVSVLLLLACMVFSGCGNENKEFPAQVSGKISYRGAPVTGGVITLHTSDGTPIQGAISNSGTYFFPNLPVGQMTVTIDTDSVNPDGAKKEEYRGGKGPGGLPEGLYKQSPAIPVPTLKKGQPTPKNSTPEGAPLTEPVFVKIPAKFKSRETSGLILELKAGKQVRDFELND